MAEKKNSGGGVVTLLCITITCIVASVMASTWWEGEALESKKEIERYKTLIQDNQIRIKNYKVEVEEKQQASHISRKCREYGLSLRASEYSQVRYIYERKASEPEVEEATATLAVQEQP